MSFSFESSKERAWAPSQKMWPCRRVSPTPFVRGQPSGPSRIQESGSNALHPHGLLVGIYPLVVLYVRGAEITSVPIRRACGKVPRSRAPGSRRQDARQLAGTLSWGQRLGPSQEPGDAVSYGSTTPVLSELPRHALLHAHLGVFTTALLAFFFFLILE